MACAWSASRRCSRARSGSCASTCAAASAGWSAPRRRWTTTTEREAHMLKVVFLFLMAGGLPVAIAMAGASLIYLVWAQTTPPFVVIHRMIYGMMANVSVGALFLAGILPGALMALFMMVMVSWHAWRNGWGSDLKLNWPRFGKAVGELAIVIAWPLAMWLLIAHADMPPRAT